MLEKWTFANYYWKLLMKFFLWLFFMKLSSLTKEKRRDQPIDPILTFNKTLKFKQENWIKKLLRQHVKWRGINVKVSWFGAIASLIKIWIWLNPSLFCAWKTKNLCFDYLLSIRRNNRLCLFLDNNLFFLSLFFFHWQRHSGLLHSTI